MADDDKQSTEFFGDSWLGRILRGEEKVELASTEPPKWPKFAETAHMDRNGKITVSRSWYGLDGSKAIGDSVLKNPDSHEYQEVLTRHPGLVPDRTTTYEEYHDGRWELSRGRDVIAEGQSDLELPGEKQSA